MGRRASAGPHGSASIPWPKPAGAKNTREFRVYRWSQDDGQNPSIDNFYIDVDDCGPMVLDGLLYIKNKI
ncbi:hypothetical protein ACC684_38640, partial [Rhizobium ruizarguesonis]